MIGYRQAETESHKVSDTKTERQSEQIDRDKKKD